MNILFKIKCGNKKCNREVSILNDDSPFDFIEVSIDFGEKTVEYICPYCSEQNKILLGKSDQVKFPSIGGVR